MRIYPQSNSYDFKICAKDSDNFSKNFNLFLIGEYHVQNGNFKIFLTYYNYLNMFGLYPKYILDEWAPSWGYLMNKYLETGDKEVLYLLESNESQKQLYKDYRRFYLTLPKDKKIKFVGVDVERDFLGAHYAVRDILLQCNLCCGYKFNSNQDTGVTCKSDAEVSLCSIIRMFKKNQNPIVPDGYVIGELDLFLSFFSEEPMTVKSSLSENLYFELQQILKSYEIAKKRKKLFMQNENNDFQLEREQFMTNNIYQLFVKEPDAIVYGQFGLDHVLLSTYKNRPKLYEKSRLAIMLNSDKKYPLTNNKVNSNIIYYDYFKPKMYKFLKSDLTYIKNEFSKMQDCQLKVIDFENKSRANNLILFKTK